MSKDPIAELLSALSQDGHDIIIIRAKQKPEAAEPAEVKQAAVAPAPVPEPEPEPTPAPTPAAPTYAEKTREERLRRERRWNQNRIALMFRRKDPVREKIRATLEQMPFTVFTASDVAILADTTMEEATAALASLYKANVVAAEHLPGAGPGKSFAYAFAIGDLRDDVALSETLQRYKTQVDQVARVRPLKRRGQ